MRSASTCRSTTIEKVHIHVLLELDKWLHFLVYSCLVYFFHFIRTEKVTLHLRSLFLFWFLVVWIYLCLCFFYGSVEKYWNIYYGGLEVFRGFFPWLFTRDSVNPQRCLLTIRRYLLIYAVFLNCEVIKACTLSTSFMSSFLLWTVPGRKSWDSSRLFWWTSFLTVVTWPFALKLLLINKLFDNVAKRRCLLSQFPFFKVYCVSEIYIQLFFSLVLFWLQMTWKPLALAVVMSKLGLSLKVTGEGYFIRH